MTVWERKIVERDAPEWIAATIGQHSAHEAESATALDLADPESQHQVGGEGDPHTL